MLVVSGESHLDAGGIGIVGVLDQFDDSNALVTDQFIPEEGNDSCPWAHPGMPRFRLSGFLFGHCVLPSCVTNGICRVVAVSYSVVMQSRLLVSGGTSGTPSAAVQGDYSPSL